jgi:hypothetical protein
MFFGLVSGDLASGGNRSPLDFVVVRRYYMGADREGWLGNRSPLNFVDQSVPPSASLAVTFCIFDRSSCVVVFGKHLLEPSC